MALARGLRESVESAGSKRETAGHWPAAKYSERRNKKTPRESFELSGVFNKTWRYLLSRW